MTKANILRKYFKKFYNLDLTGMSLAEVLKQFMKAQYNYDSKGSGVVSIVQEMIDNDLAPGDGGSGGAEDVMVVHGVENGSKFELDKTWQEMMDYFNPDDPLTTNIVIIDQIQGNIDFVIDVDISAAGTYRVSSSFNHTYLCDNPTDYPSRNI